MARLSMARKKILVLVPGERARTGGIRLELSQNSAQKCVMDASMNTQDETEM